MHLTLQGAVKHVRHKVKYAVDENITEADAIYRH